MPRSPPGISPVENKSQKTICPRLSEELGKRLTTNCVPMSTFMFEYRSSDRGILGPWSAAQNLGLALYLYSCPLVKHCSELWTRSCGKVSARPEVPFGGASARLGRAIAVFDGR